MSVPFPSVPSLLIANFRVPILLLLILLLSESAFPLGKDFARVPNLGKAGT